jgi:thiol-disulfide isomerase/thioredoxin
MAARPHWRIEGARRLRAVALTCLIGGLLLAGCAGRSATGSSATSANSTDVVGVTTFPVSGRSLPPALEGKTLTGTAMSVSSYAPGDIVFINVWASWCDPCRAESPMLAAESKALANDGVRFLGIDEQDTAPAARAFVTSVGATYPDLVDTDGSLLRKLKLLPQMGVPSTLVLDRHGRMAARVIGPMTAQQLQKIVKTLGSEA